MLVSVIARVKDYDSHESAVEKVASLCYNVDNWILCQKNHTGAFWCFKQTDNIEDFLSYTWIMDEENNLITQYGHKEYIEPSNDYFRLLIGKIK